MLTAILPLTTSGWKTRLDLERFRLQVISYDTYLEAGTFSKILVYVPDEELEKIKAQVSSWDTTQNIEVLSERPLLLLPDNSTIQKIGGYEGWYTQQLVKLNAALHISDPWYLTLDADVLCCKPTSLADLFPEGKALCTHDRKATHLHWWKSSYNVLKLKPNLTDRGCGVTPMLLHTDSVKSLLSKLDKIYKKPHNQALVELIKHGRKWTEYTLYWAHLSENLKTHDTLYSQVSLQSCGHWGGSWSDFKPNLSFNTQGKGKHFVVIQSKSGMHPTRLYAELKQYIDPSKKYDPKLRILPRPSTLLSPTDA